MSKQIVHPAALIGLAHVLQSGYPNMSAQQAVSNAKQIILGLHKMDLQVGPVAAFGPQQAAGTGTSFDALDIVADMVELEQGRKPWLPDGMQ